jgi:hypothetical protein
MTSVLIKDDREARASSPNVNNLLHFAGKHPQILQIFEKIK